MEVEPLESLEFGVVADYCVKENWVLEVLIFDYVVECFEEDM